MSRRLVSLIPYAIGAAMGVALAFMVPLHAHAAPRQAPARHRASPAACIAKIDAGYHLTFGPVFSSDIKGARDAAVMDQCYHAVGYSYMHAPLDRTVTITGTIYADGSVIAEAH